MRVIRDAQSITILLLSVLLTLSLATEVIAVPGDVQRTFTVTVGTGGYRGVAFDGTNLYVTRTGSASIFKLTTLGVLLATIPTTGYSCGGPLAWDGTYLWTTGYNLCEDNVLYQIDPSNGSVVSQADVSAAKAAFSPDGLDWQNSRLVLSAEINDPWVSLLNQDGTIISEFRANQKPSITPSLIGPSGISFDGNGCLWLVYPSNVQAQLVQTDLNGAETGASIMLPQSELLEDIALDAVTFAPKTVVWGMNNTGTMYAIEIGPVGGCGPTPSRKTSWGTIKTIYR